MEKPLFSANPSITTRKSQSGKNKRARPSQQTVTQTFTLIHMNYSEIDVEDVTNYQMESRDGIMVEVQASCLQGYGSNNWMHLWEVRVERDNTAVNSQRRNTSAASENPLLDIAHLQ